MLGQPITITVTDGQVKINDATVIITDIETSNGVIHVIDSVILPPAEEAEAAPMAMDIVDTAIADGRFTTWWRRAGSRVGGDAEARGYGLAPTDEPSASCGGTVVWRAPS